MRSELSGRFGLACCGRLGGVGSVGWGEAIKGGGQTRFVEWEGLRRRHFQKREFGKPASEGKRAIFFLFGVAADEELFFGAGRGHIEHAVVFGFGAVVFETGSELPSGGVEVVGV